MASQLCQHRAKHRTFTVDGQLLAALDTGGPGPTVVMIPGFTGSKEDFAPLLDPLQQQGFRAVAYDQPGHFESPGSDNEADYTPEALAQLAVGLLQQLPGPHLLLGHSYGGLVAQAVIRTRTHPSAVVLLGSGPGALPADIERVRDMQACRIILRQSGVRTLAQARADAAAAGPQPPEPELAQFLLRRFLTAPPAMLHSICDILLHVPDCSAATAAARGNTPIFVIAGRDDDAWPLAQQQQMAACYGTELSIVEQAAHFPSTENPAGLLAALAPALAHLR